jgi:hypothetical protein
MIQTKHLIMQRECEETEGFSRAGGCTHEFDYAKPEAGKRIWPGVELSERKEMTGLHLPCNVQRCPAGWKHTCSFVSAKCCVISAKTMRLLTAKTWIPITQKVRAATEDTGGCVSGLRQQYIFPCFLFGSGIFPLNFFFLELETNSLMLSELWPYFSLSHMWTQGRALSVVVPSAGCVQARDFWSLDMSLPLSWALHANSIWVCLHELVTVNTHPCKTHVPYVSFLV